MAGGEYVRQLSKEAVLPSPALTPNHHHPGLIPFGRRMLRDKLIGQGEIEVAKLHPISVAEIEIDVGGVSCLRVFPSQGSFQEERASAARVQADGVGPRSVRRRAR